MLLSPVICSLKLYESITLALLKVTITPLLFTASLSLQYCHKLADVSKSLLLYFIKLYIDITTSIYLAILLCALFISLMQSVKGAQFLNVITFLSPFFATTVFGAVIVPSKSIYTSL